MARKGFADSGHTGEGISVKDPGSSIVVKGKHFMRDAVRDTAQRADRMIEESSDKIFR
jgi:hypothetical protein